jgi:hypothetical protein
MPDAMRFFDMPIRDRKAALNFFLIQFNVAGIGIIEIVES